MSKAKRAVDLSAARSIDAQLTQEGFSSIHEAFVYQSRKVISWS
jgi:hypothetical protein